MEKHQIMNCRKLIYEILDGLDVDFETVNEFVQADKKSVETLKELSVTCSEQMRKITEDFLERVQEQEENEYKFQVLIRALAGRKDMQTLRILTTALLKTEAADKNTYISFIEQLNDPKTVPWVIEFLDSNELTEGNEEAVSRAIDFLRFNQARAAAKIVISKLNDESSEVRLSAIYFLKALDVREAESNLIEQLGYEDNSENMQLIIQILKNWKTNELSSILRKLLISETIKKNSELQEIIIAEMAGLA